MRRKKRTAPIARWEWQPFLAKVLTAQGAAITTLITNRTTDPWQWASCLFIALMIAAGVDTGTWLTADPKKQGR